MESSLAVLFAVVEGHLSPPIVGTVSESLGFLRRIPGGGGSCQVVRAYAIELTDLRTEVSRSPVIGTYPISTNLAWAASDEV